MSNVGLDPRPMNERLGIADADPLAYAYGGTDDIARFLLALSEEPYEPERVAAIDYSRSAADLARVGARYHPRFDWTGDLGTRVGEHLLTKGLLSICNRAGARGERRYIAHPNALGVIATYRRRIEAGVAAPTPP